MTEYAQGGKIGPPAAHATYGFGVDHGCMIRTESTMTAMTGGSAKHGMTWFSGYALVRPAELKCGFITNPDEDVMALLKPCGLAATYEFQFTDRGFDSWSAACTEHASVVRRLDLIDRIRSIGKGGEEVPGVTYEQRAWLVQTGWAPDGR